VTSVTFTGDQYAVSDGGITSIVPVPADEFVISLNTSSSETYIYLLADDDDYMTSDMIFIQFSSYNSYAGICTAKFSNYQTLSLPYKRGTISRRCYYVHIYSNYNVSTHLHFKFYILLLQITSLQGFKIY